jgi:hypothetical protein
LDYNVEELCFLRGPCRNVISETRYKAFSSNHVKYVGVIFDKTVTWRLHIEMIEALAFRTFIEIYSQFKNEPLSANIKPSLHKALIRSVMTYACLA